jgi:hypothetical protein
LGLDAAAGGSAVFTFAVADTFVAVFLVLVGVLGVGCVGISLLIISNL